jgi:alpha-galactosidase
MSTDFVKIRCIDENDPIVRIGSGLLHYEERFVDGRLLTTNWSTVGIIDYEPQSYGYAIDNAAFRLEIDGVSLHRGWTWAGIADADAERSGQVHRVVTLTHRDRPITVRVHTIIDGTAILMRWLDIKNTGTQPARLGALSVWSGRVFPIQAGWKGWADMSIFHTVHGPYSLGYFAQKRGFCEGDFQWVPIGNETIEIGQNVGRSGWGHPIAYLRDEASGQMFVMQLAWSANWAIRVTPDIHRWAMGRDVPPQLFAEIGPVASSPMRIIDAGEMITTPRVHLGCIAGDLTDMQQMLHEHQRRSVLVAPPHGKENLISYNHSGYDIEKMTFENNVFKQIDVAAEIGVDVFTVDACWNGNDGQHWVLSTGDWMTQNRLPNGLEAVYAYARKKGLKAGLWCWIEAANEKSDLIGQHPDWLLTRDGQRLNNQLDLSRNDVAQWVEDELARLVERYQLDLYRIDYNESPLEGGYNKRHGIDENTLWRYYENWYRIIDNTRKRFPNLIIENCAGGGGRTDLGMTSRTHFTWISDYSVLPRSLRTLTTAQLALTPELTARTFGVCMDSHIGGSLDMQLRATFMCGNPCVVGVWHDREDLCTLLRDRIRHAIDIYRRHVRPMIAQCRVTLHTPIPSGQQPQGWCVLEYASPDRRQAVIGAFRLAGPADSEYVIQPRGLSRSRSYRILHDNTGDATVVSGEQLIERGIVVRLTSAMSSEWLIIEAVAS